MILKKDPLNSPESIRLRIQLQFTIRNTGTKIGWYIYDTLQTWHVCGPLPLESAYSLLEPCVSHSVEWRTLTQVSVFSMFSSPLLGHDWFIDCLQGNWQQCDPNPHLSQWLASLVPTLSKDTSSDMTQSLSQKLRAQGQVLYIDIFSWNHPGFDFTAVLWY